MSFYSFMFAVFVKPIKWLYRLRVEGDGYLPTSDSHEGVLVCANHTSMSDVYVLSAALGGRRLRYMSKAELFRIPLVGRFFRELGAYPIKRGGADVASIKLTLKLLEDGEIVGVFPQGTRQPGISAAEAKPKNGVGMFAYRSRCRVIPVYIATKKHKTAMFRRTRVIFGEPLDYGALGFSEGGSAEYTHAAEVIMQAIADIEAKTEL